MTARRRAMNRSRAAEAGRATQATALAVATESAPSPPSRREWIGPASLVSLAVVFGLWTLRSALQFTSYPNDLALHLQMVTLSQHLLAHGQLPLGHWYPNLSTGSPFFVQYQSSSAILTGALGLLVGTQHAFTWTLYLLIALWPICIYLTGRLLTWGRWESAVAAALAPLLYSVTGHGFEHQAYLWLGSGLWSQLWAMWTLPLAIAFSWRYINERRFLFGAVAMLSATIALHFLMAYLAGLVLVVLVVLRPSDILGRLGRGALVGASAILATLWITVPLLSDAKWTAINEFQVHTVINDSYGAGQVLSWLFSGQLFDSDRLPVITVLVGVGLVVCVSRFRRDERARVLVSVGALSLLLFFGRPTMGWLIDLLPGNKNLLLQRYVTGVQLAGLLLAGVGAVWLGNAVVAVARRLPATASVLGDDTARRRAIRAAIAVALLVVLVAPALTQLASYGSQNASWVSGQQRADAVQGAQVKSLLAIAEHRSGGRVFAGLPSTWGLDFTVGSVPVYNFMEDTPVDAMGLTLRTSSLMTGPEAYFDDTNPGDYTAFGVRYLLLPAGKAPPVPARFVAQAGSYLLYEVSGPDLFSVVDTTTAIAADSTNLGKKMGPFLHSSLPGRGIYPVVAYAGLPAAAPTLAPGAAASGPAGQVLTERDRLVAGAAVATVFANRIAVVVLHSAYDPGWTATVDGVARTPEMVAPAEVGVTVAPGVHTVAFQYRGYGSYPALLAVSIVTLLAVGVGPSLWRRAETRWRARRTRGVPA